MGYYEASEEGSNLYLVGVISVLIYRKLMVNKIYLLFNSLVV